MKFYSRNITNVVVVYAYRRRATFYTTMLIQGSYILISMFHRPINFQPINQGYSLFKPTFTPWSPSFKTFLYLLTKQMDDRMRSGLQIGTDDTEIRHKIRNEKMIYRFYSQTHGHPHSYSTRSPYEKISDLLNIYCLFNLIWFLFSEQKLISKILLPMVTPVKTWSYCKLAEHGGSYRKLPYF